MPNLVSVSQLATWARADESTVAEDPFAAMVLEHATDIVVEAANKPNWRDQTPAVVVPKAAGRICLFLAARTYLNPDGEVSTTVGPIGSRIPELMATAAAQMALLPAEVAALEELGSDGTDPNGLWVQPTEYGAALYGDDVYLPDNSGSDWYIPYGDGTTTVAFTPLVP